MEAWSREHEKSRIKFSDFIQKKLLPCNAHCQACFPADTVALDECHVTVVHARPRPLPLSQPSCSHLRFASLISSVDYSCCGVVIAIAMDRAEEAQICKACGVQFSPFENLPQVCPICSDERQAVPKGGQQWTSHSQLKNGPYMNKWTKYEPGLYAFNTEPKVGIGQRAFLVQTAHGNILWDCISLLDEATIDIVKALGGLKAIAISHPHYYANNAQWSSAFGNVPVYIHEKDKKWVMWEHENVKFWSGETLRVLEGATLIQLGGHFAGGQVLHWAEGVGGEGALLTGDIIQVNALDHTTVSVMRSYPNYIPLSASHVHRIASRLEPWAFERVYGGFWNFEVMEDAKARVEYSLQRYVKWLTDDDPDV